MEISRIPWNHYIVLLGILSIAGLSTGRPQQVEDPLKRDVPVLTDPKPHISQQNDNRYMKNVRKNITDPNYVFPILLGNSSKTNKTDSSFSRRKTGTPPHSNVNNHHENNKSSPNKNRKTVMSFLAELPLEIVERPVLIEDHTYEGVSNATDDRLNYTDIINDAIYRRSGRKVTARRNYRDTQSGNATKNANFDRSRYDFRDRKVYKNFLRRATADLTTDRLRKRKLPLRDRTRVSAMKRWPDSQLLTQNEYESYQNYTRFTEDDDSNDGVQHLAVSTSQKRPVIHQVLTKWSDTASYDDFDTLHPTISTNDVKDVVTFNQFNEESSVEPTVFSDNVMGVVSTVEPFVDFYSNGQSVDSSKINERPVDEPTVYIRPKPVYTSSVNQNNNDDRLTFHPRPPIGSQDVFSRPTPSTPFPPFSPTSASRPAQNSYVVANGPATIVLSTKPGYHDKHPVQVVTPSYTNSKPNIVNLGPTRPDLADDNVYFPSGKPVTPVPIGDDGCPLVYITLNNTVQNKAKEGCADIHLIINSNVLNSNNVVDDSSDEQIGPNGYPIASSVEDTPDYADETVYSAGDVPVVEGVNSVVPLTPVFSSPLNAEAAVAELPLASDTVSNSLSPLSGSIPQLGGLPGGGQAVQGGGGSSRPDDEEESGGIMSWFTTAMDTFTYMSLMNPFNYGIFSFLLAPLVIFAAGGVGLVSLLMPWTWSGVLERNSKTIIGRPMSNWKWHEDYNTWNWAGFPNRYNDWITKDSKIDKEDNAIQVSTYKNGLKDIAYTIYNNVRKWAYDKYLRLFGRSRNRSLKRSTSVDESKKENWKKRRK